MASSSISERSSYSGQTSPVMCSLSASPVPTPNRNRPGIIDATVAVAWAMIAGWIRPIGQVTPVPTSSDVSWASAPSTDHTNGLWPWRSIHGWKWSLIIRKSKPACSASLACAMRSFGLCSSEDSA